MKRQIIVLIALFVLFLVGCGVSKQVVNSPSPTSTPIPTQSVALEGEEEEVPDREEGNKEEGSKEEEPSPSLVPSEAASPIPSPTPLPTPTSTPTPSLPGEYRISFKAGENGKLAAAKGFKLPDDTYTATPVDETLVGADYGDVVGFYAYPDEGYA